MRLNEGGRGGPGHAPGAGFRPRTEPAPAAPLYALCHRNHLAEPPRRRPGRAQCRRRQCFSRLCARHHGHVLAGPQRAPQRGRRGGLCPHSRDRARHTQRACRVRRARAKAHPCPLQRRRTRRGPRREHGRPSLPGPVEAKETQIAADLPAPAKSATLAAAGVTVYLPLAGLVDFAAERKRIQGEIPTTSTARLAASRACSTIPALPARLPPRSSTASAPSSPSCRANAVSFPNAWLTSRLSRLALLWPRDL